MAIKHFVWPNCQACYATLDGPTAFIFVRVVSIPPSVMCRGSIRFRINDRANRWYQNTRFLIKTTTTEMNDQINGLNQGKKERHMKKLHDCLQCHSNPCTIISLSEMNTKYHMKFITKAHIKVFNYIRCIKEYPVYKTSNRRIKTPLPSLAWAAVATPIEPQPSRQFYMEA